MFAESAEAAAAVARQLAARDALREAAARLRTLDPPLVLAFPSEAAIASGALDLIAGFRARGATVMMAGHAGGDISLPLAEADPATRPILILQSFYRLAEAVAQARGHDPTTRRRSRK
jgi:fructoselysine-6-P-deglycase FrlB-like protein